jgi:Family of unknown function (DUF5908)
MTVEIREIVIKTEIVTEENRDGDDINVDYLEKMKGKIVRDCIELIKKDKKSGFRNR